MSTTASPARVLIAEDNPQGAELLEAYLAETTYETRIAANGDSSCATAEPVGQAAATSVANTNRLGDNSGPRWNVRRGSNGSEEKGKGRFCCGDRIRVIWTKGVGHAGETGTSLFLFLGLIAQSEKSFLV